MALREYSFNNMIFIVNGFEIKGFADGDDVVAVARREDSATDRVGAQGEMTVSVNTNKSGTFTFNLMQTSESNAYMSGLMAAQENGIFVPVTAQIKDTRGGDLSSGTQGYITKPSDMQRGVGVNTQQWVIVVERLDMLLTGAASL
jgi:hypothetical protein